MKDEDDQQSESAQQVEVEYVRAVEERLQQLRERPLVLSPADLERVLRWYRGGAPLGLVLAAMEETFRHAAAQRPPRRPRSLAYCEPAIEESLQLWRESRPGAEASVREEFDPNVLLGGAMAEIDASLAPAEWKIRACGLLSDLQRVAASAPARFDLERLDAQLIDACWAALDEGERSAIDERVAVSLERHGTELSPAARERTVRALRTRRVRQRFRLPDLTLLPLR